MLSEGSVPDSPGDAGLPVYRGLRQVFERFDRRSLAAVGLLLGTFAAVGLSFTDLLLTNLWVGRDRLLFATWALMIALLAWDIRPRRDAMLAVAGFLGGLVIEWWGTTARIWVYFSAERPPVWILPCWSVAALAIDRLARVLTVFRPIERHAAFLYWTLVPAFALWMTGFLRPAVEVPSSWVVLFLMAATILWRPRPHRDVCLFLAGTALGVLLETWGTTRRCWTYYTGETPPWVAVAAHGFASVAFSRAIQFVATSAGPVLRRWPGLIAVLALSGCIEMRAYSSFPRRFFDFDGDGRADVFVGARSYASSTGRVYLFLGPVSSFSSPASAGGASTVFTGEQAGDRFGSWVADLGDVNGDGLDDLGIAAPEYPASAQRGRLYVFFGRASPPTSLAAADADLAITGEADGDLFGIRVVGAGDVDGDGIDDFLAGAVAAAGGAGRAYLWRGRRVWPGSMDAAEADTIVTGAAGDALGGGLGGGGDLNGDGRADLAVGATGNGGRVFVFFGRSVFPAAFNDPYTEADAVRVGEDPADTFGASVSVAGDLDRDGFDDVAVGASDYPAGAGRGRVYVFRGAANLGGSAGAASADMIVTGENDGDSLGVAVSSGDVIGDGVDDLAIGAMNHAPGSQRGRVYVLRGRASLPAALDAGAAELILDGEADGDVFGIHVAIAGDVNRDGIADLAVGAPGHDAAGSDAGRFYVILGAMGTGGVRSAATAEWIVEGENAGDGLGCMASATGGAGPRLWMIVLAALALGAAVSRAAPRS